MREVAVREVESNSVASLILSHWNGECRMSSVELYSDEIGLRNSTQLCMVWIPAFAGMTTTRFFANHSVWSIRMKDVGVGSESSPPLMLSSVEV